MSVETPRRLDKKMEYTSPIGILKNFNSSTLSKDVVVNSHQQEFYKIKSSRLEAELAELRDQNMVIKAKLTDASTNVQVLKERIFVLENQAERNNRRTIPSFVTDSNFNSGKTSLRGSPSDQSKFLSGTYSYMDKTQRTATNAQIERLTKQNRILKNEHDLEIDKLQNEVKLLNRKIAELETISSSSPKRQQSLKQEQEESVKMKYEQRIEKQIQINQQLRDESTRYENERKKMDEKIKNGEIEIKRLRKENEELELLISSHKRSDRALTDLQIRNQELTMEIKKLYAENQGLKSTRSPQKNKHEESVESSDSNLKELELAALNNEQNMEQRDFSRMHNQLKTLRRELSRSSDIISEKNEQITNMLSKLKPLISIAKSQNQTEIQSLLEKNSCRASLSLLQVFLQKYKINAF